jgi:hypothetical protein
VTPAQIGQQLRAAYVLAGSLRRSGNRLRINAQLIDTHTDFPLWTERYDREMADVFELQDDIAHKIAEALRITLTPQEQEALAAKPTGNPQAYDLFLRGRSYARRMVRQDLEFALQLYENAVAQDPEFALAYAAIANVCAVYHYNFEREASWLERARAASQKAIALEPELPEAKVAQAWILYASAEYEEAPRERGRGAQAGHRERLLPAPACLVRFREISGDRARCGGRDRSQRHGLQRLRAGHECPGRTRQAGGLEERAPALHPGP